MFFENLQFLVDIVCLGISDWDDEEGKPVHLKTVIRAKKILSDIHSSVKEAGKTWVNPAVSSTPEGGIHFSWLVSGNRAALTFLQSEYPIICVTKMFEKKSRRELLNDCETLDKVVQIFSHRIV